MPQRRSTPSQRWSSLGAYASPFTGQGVDFEPLSPKPFALDVAIHESGFFPRRPYWNYQNVFSPFWRLYYNFEPGHRVIFSDREVHLGPDRLILIPDHQLFHTMGTKGKPHFWIHFSVERHLSPAMSIPLELAPSSTELSLIGDLKNLLRKTKSSIDRSRVYYYSAALLLVVLNRPEIGWQADLPGNLQQTIRYIEEHFASPLYVGDLARLARLSESVLRREFLKLRRVPPTKFILQVRVREAAHLLSATHLALEEIAARIGFPNTAYLDRVFRRITGMAPGRFRQQAQRLLLNRKD
jgi:AraC-like DNA-binding protein